MTTFFNKKDTRNKEIRIFVYDKKQQVAREVYYSDFIPRKGDILDLEFIRHRSNYSFKEQYAKIKSIKFYYSRPKKNEPSFISIAVKAKIIKENDRK